MTGGYVGRYAIVPHRYRRTPAAGIWARLRQLVLDPAQIDLKTDPLALYRKALNVPLGRGQISDAFTPEFVRAGHGFDPAAVISDTIAAAPSRDPWDIVMYVDATTYLHGLLVLEDKLSMAHGLETRVPLLDNAVLDHLLKTDWRLLSDGVEGKKLFRRAVEPWVPSSIARKPKMGFAPPDASWYRTSLKSFVERRLAPNRILRRGVFQPKFIERVLADHAAGAANHVALIWSLLSFEAWCDQAGAFGGAYR
jgi:asparagine synthase (glutamine-hydrolysing)